MFFQSLKVGLGRGAVISSTVVEDRGDCVHPRSGYLTADVHELDRADGGGDHPRRGCESYCPVGIAPLVRHITNEGCFDATGGRLFRGRSE